MAKNPQQSAILISVAGAIGAGKTTLAGKLARALSARLLEEDISGNELLAAFYKNPQQYALPVQCQFLLSRFGQLRKDSWPSQGLAVTDYIFDKDPMFAALNLQGPQLQIYHGLWQAVKDLVRTPDVVLYLQADPDLLLQRIQERNRSFEHGITREYLQRVVDGYEALMAEYMTCPVIRITSASEPARNQDSWSAMARQLASALPALAGKFPDVPPD